MLDIGRNVSRFIAMIAIPWVYSVAGWATAVVTASVLLVVFSLPGILRPEPPRPETLTRERPSLKRLLQREDSYYIYPMCFLVGLTGGLIATLYLTYLSDLGYSIVRLAAVLAPATLFGTVIGAVSTSWCLRHYRYKSTMLVAAVGVLLAVIPIIWMGSLTAPSFAIVFLVTLNAIALPSFLDVTFQAARLKWASRTHAATDYTTQIVTLTAGVSLSTAIGGFLAEHLGWFYYFALAGVLISAACFLLYAVFDRIETLVGERDAREQAVARTGDASVPPNTGDRYVTRRL